MVVVGRVYSDIVHHEIKVLDLTEGEMTPILDQSDFKFPRTLAGG